MNKKNKIKAIVAQVNPELIVVVGKTDHGYYPLHLHNLNLFTGADGNLDPSKIRVFGFANMMKGYHKIDQENSFFKEKAQSQRTRNIGSIVSFPEVRSRHLNGEIVQEVEMKDVQYLVDYNMITHFDFNRYLTKPKKLARFKTEEARQEYLASQEGIFFNGVHGSFPDELAEVFNEITILPIDAAVSLGYFTNDKKYLLNQMSVISLQKLTDLSAPLVEAGLKHPIVTYTMDTPGVGQQREGHAVFIAKDVHPYTVFRQNGLNFDIFTKKMDIDGIRCAKIDASKAYKRNNLNDSSSTKHDLFEKLGKLKEVDSQTFYALDGELMVNEEGREVPAVDEKGRVKTKETTVRVFEVVDPKPGYFSWKGTKIALADDMEAWVDIQTQVTAFEMQDGNVLNKSLQLVQAWIKKNLTDGAVLAGDKFAKYFKQNRKNGIKMRSAIQFRMDPVGKGLMVFARKLAEYTGFDLILFDGARKGDMSVALQEGTCVFSEMNESRDPNEERGNFISSQAFYNFMFEDEVVKELLARTLAYFKAAEIDMDTAKQLISAKVIDFNDKDVKEVLDAHLDAILEDGEEVNTQSYLSANYAAEVPVQIQKRVSDLLRAIQKRAKFGQQFIEDSMMNHFVVDPFAVMQAMKDKRLYVDEKKDKVIPADHFLVAGKDNKFREGEAAIVRFPCLENAEIRKLMASIKALPAKAQAYYLESIKLGYYQGLAIFSPLDMNPEGMSGADFDGDQGAVMFDDVIVANFVNKPLFLDYSLITENGKSRLIAGCPPFGTSIKVPVLKKEDFSVDFVQDGWNLIFAQEDIDLRPERCYEVYHKLVVWNILLTMRPSSIGSYTNVLMSIVASMMEIKNEMNLVRQKIAPYAAIHASVVNGTDYSQFAVEDMENYLDLANRWTPLHNEYSTYSELAQWFTAMVRWEIDAAKHGGAYKEHMQDILSMFDPQSPDDRITYEKLMELKAQGKDYSRLFLARQDHATKEDHEVYNNSIDYSELYDGNEYYGNDYYGDTW